MPLAIVEGEGSLMAFLSLFYFLLPFLLLALVGLLVVGGVALFLLYLRRPRS